MKALKIVFGGANAVSIDWNAVVDELTAAAQRSCVAVMTHTGSDRFLPDRGTDVATMLFSYGIFDLLSLQHALNFGALKARADVQQYEFDNSGDENLVDNVRATLLGVQSGTVKVGLTVSNRAGKTTRQITEI